jgi:DNA-binding MarR family transcriptional regulator
VTDHPRSPITEIAQRTGLAQSLVSRTVDRLQALGVFTVGHDPADGRRTLVSVDPQTRRLDFADRAERPIGDAIRQVVSGMSGGRQRRIEAALDVLAEELLDRSPGPPPAGPTGQHGSQKHGSQKHGAGKPGTARPRTSSADQAIESVAVPPADDRADPGA